MSMKIEKLPILYQPFKFFFNFLSVKEFQTSIWFGVVDRFGVKLK